MERTGRFLLDTNIVIALFAGEAAVQHRLTESGEVFVPSIVLGELYYGARKSTRVTENLARIDEFVASSTVLACDTATAQQYGDIKNKLRAKADRFPKTISGLPRLPCNINSPWWHVMDIFTKLTDCGSRHGSCAATAPNLLYLDGAGSRTGGNC
jgi:tRNA(fMet)-specific endonuclease VapC